MIKSFLKHEIHQALVSALTAQAKDYDKILESIHQSKNDDTKSSAGDKFETGREMMQMEIDKTEMQLNKVNFARETLNQLKNEKSSKTVMIGSLVKCNTGTFYISIGYGSIKLDGKKYYAISMISPVGKLLMGKKSGDEFVFNDNTIKVIDVE
ncbi:MAG: transcription elongation GreA/GreB family factor [Saprospiraceae bacterium]|jgi:transcription elongation GreA/GreB family factor